MSGTKDAASIDEHALRAYLRAALAVQGLALAPDAVARVEEQFLRLAQSAAIFAELGLDAGDEPAFQFRP